MGIPEGLRTLVWPLLAQKDRMFVHCGNTYQELVEMQASAFCAQIELDVRRTFPDNVNFQNESICINSLKNILHALSVCLPDLGYCQGMNFIAASLLIVTNDENAFWILYSMIVKYKQMDKYIQPNKVLRQFYAFERLTRFFFPNLSKTLKYLQVDTFYYATDWFMTLFASVLPLPILYRVYDIFFLEGEKTLYRCGLAILRFKLDALNQCQGFEDTTMCLKNKHDIQDFDQEEFIRVMVKEFIFSKSQLNSYLLEYDQL